MDDIHTLRARSGADIVAMIVDATRYRGAARGGHCKDRMFSVKKYSCVIGYFTFDHAIGNNLGLNHDQRSKRAG